MLKITFEEFSDKKEQTREDYHIVKENQRLETHFRYWAGLGLLLLGLFLLIPGSLIGWRMAPMGMHYAFAGVVIMLVLYGLLGRQKKELLDKATRPYHKGYEDYQEASRVLIQKKALVERHAGDVLGLVHLDITEEDDMVHLSLAEGAGLAETATMEAIGQLIPEGLMTYGEFLLLGLAPDATGESEQPRQATVTKEVIVSYTDPDNEQRFLAQSDYQAPGDIWVKEEKHHDDETEEDEE